ncbi:MAG: hypothetical protein ACR2MP_13045 [Streptosporangiaceae bacterium]
MIRPRSQATALILAGLAAAAPYLWLRNPALPIAGAFLVGIGTSWLLALRRRSPAQREHEHMIRELWSAGFVREFRPHLFVMSRDSYLGPS